MKPAQHEAFAAGGPLLGGMTALLLLLALVSSLNAETPPPLPDPPAPDFGDTPPTSEPQGEPELRFYVKQIRVRGSQLLTNAEIETVIYPFLGPGRTLTDLEGARTALEKAFRDKGYQTVSVELPQQNGTRGVIYMNVVENRIGRLTVKGARYFLPSEIKRAAPSLAEGSVPDFNKVTKDLVALNAWPERQVTPSIRPGSVPGTVDVELEVKDKAPVHGGIDLNNNFINNTTELRLDASFTYNNLWQKGHVFGLSTQISPQNLDDSRVISSFYLVRFPQLSRFSLQLMASQQNSSVGTLGGLATVGNGSTAGVRGIFQLRSLGDYFQSISAGFDYKAFSNKFDRLPGANGIDLAPDAQNLLSSLTLPIYYYPISVSYNAGLAKKNSFTEFNAALQFHLRGVGSDITTFDFTRYRSDGSWLSLRSDIAHTQDLPKGFQLFGKFQTQLTNDALIPNEQFVIGGASTVRGYPVATALGDNGWVLNFEVRTPSLISSKGEADGDTQENEIRFRAFFDAGTAYTNDVLPEQIKSHELASFGFGTTIDLWKNFHGALDVAWPLVTQGVSAAAPSGTSPQHDPFLNFHVGYNF